MGEIVIHRWEPPQGPPSTMGLLAAMPQRAWRALVERVLREPAGSRLRTRGLSEALRAGWEIANRRQHVSRIRSLSRTRLHQLLITQRR